MPQRSVPFAHATENPPLSALRSRAILLRIMGQLVPVRPLRREEKTLWSSHAAHAWNDDGCELVVIDEFPSTLTVCDEVEARARLVLGLRHPNLATVREVARDDGSCKVVSDWIEGERLDALRAAGPLEAE